jgi:hypothetical protein
MNSSILVGVGALLLGGVGGYMVGNSGPVESGAEVTARLASKTDRSGGTVAGGPRRASRSNFEDIMKEPGQTARLQSLMNYYAGLDPTKFAEEAGKLDDLPFSERLIASYLLFSRWAEVDPISAMAHADTMGRGGFMVRPTILQSWASTDPKGAARYFEDNPRDFAMMGGFGGRGGGGDSAAGQIAAEWAKQDPSAALEWAQGLEGRNASSALGSIFRQMAEDDPGKAAQMAAGLDDEQRAGAYRSIAREWGETDWAGAESWISGLPAEEQGAAMAQAIRGLAGDDPQFAAKQISKISDPEARDDAIRSVAENWAQEDPAAAAEWLVKQDSEELGRPMREVVSAWTNQDSAAALAFVTSQPEGDLRDSAVATYVFANREGEVSESLALAESIGDEESRSRAIAVTALRWMEDDKEAALQYIKATDSLGDKAKQRIWQRANGAGDRRGR